MPIASRRILRPRFYVCFALLAGVSLAGLGCSGSATGGVDDDGGLGADAGDGSTDDSSGGDTGHDTGALDSGVDTSIADTFDAASLDTGVDTRPLDTGVDTTPVDTGFPTCSLDSDSDTIFDEIEGRFATGAPTDTDGDGTPDYLDLDSDNDGISDKIEWADKSCSATGLNDADSDGKPNFQDLDSDANGLLDKDEGCPPAAMLTLLGKPACTLASPEDFDGDGVGDWLDSDNDHDSLASALEVGLDDSYELKNAAGTYVGISLDFDTDGVPDLWDRDSDNDNIFDLEDGIGDVDKDGAQNFRDLDSDGDGVKDWCEARANPVSTPTYVEAAKKVFDTDLDTKPDFLDTDTDNDLLADKLEDLDGNCIVGPLETDRLKADTDGDGVSDLIEVTLLGPAEAKDATKTPNNQGKFYFVVPYSADGSAKPSPTSTPLALSTTLNQGDVAFVVDTTTSMDGIESNLSSSIATKIIPALAAKIPDLQLGVIGYDDALAKPWGDSAGDSFIWFPNGYATGSAMGTTTNATLAAAGLTHVSPGGSYPEGSIPALWWAMTGDSFSFTSSTAVTKSFAAAPAPGAGQFGGLHFRNTALPIVINTSDANMHNGITTDCKVLSTVTSIPPSLCTPISYGTDGAKASSLGHSPSIDELIAKFNSVGAKYIGVSVHGPGGSKSADVNRTLDAAYYASAVDMLYIARGTASKVAPSVLGGTATDCKTSQTGGTKNVADADGLCPLVFDIGYTGTGLGDTVASAVVGLLNGLKFDVHVQAIPVIAGSVDPVNSFMKTVLPSPTGGTDPVTLKTCVTFPAAQTADNYVGPKATVGTDGDKETITGLNPGPLYCYNVVPKENTTVAATSSAQVFHATLRVFADKPKPPVGPGGTFTLGGDRDVLFLVPPIVN